MHREIRDHIEDVLRGGVPLNTRGSIWPSATSAGPRCRACRNTRRLIRELRAPEDFAADPRPDFYARVMERIEAEGPISIWNLFIESAFGRRIAVASLALALLIGVYVVTSERSAEDPMIAQQAPAGELRSRRSWRVKTRPAREITQMDESQTDQSSQDAVLANLVTYREQ